MPERAVEHPTSGPADSTRSPRRRHRDSVGQRRQKGLRVIYFSMAAIWGCVAGSAGVLAVAASRGQRLPFSSGLAIAVGLALLAAVAGGLVSSMAYREARKR